MTKYNDMVRTKKSHIRGTCDLIYFIFIIYNLQFFLYTVNSVYKIFKSWQRFRLSRLAGFPGHVGKARSLMIFWMVGVGVGLKAFVI